MADAPRELTPPIVQGQTAKEKKYDRQLRLWAASGQRALEESHVLLIIGSESIGSNSSAAGVETLKNLILPGIGQFTIADSETVKEADLGVNFFLEPDSLNKSRAEATTRLLLELNPDVSGHAITSPLSEWLPLEDSLRPFNLILLSAPIPTETLQWLASYAHANSLPLIYIQSAGFYACFSIQLPSEFPIVDTHPDPETMQDLRLLAPWPELEATVDALGDIAKLRDHDHGHIPYILLLLYYLREWKTSHDNSYPSTFKEKTEFRDLVRSGTRTNNPEGGEENYEEATAAVLKSIAPPPIGSGCKDLFSMAQTTELGPSSSNFWIIAHAIKVFYDAHGVLPLPGSLPDMKATSEEYIKLQNLYKSKARSDIAEVKQTVQQLLETKLDKATTSPIPDVEIDSFCKNASQVRVLTNPDGTLIPSLRMMKSDPKLLATLPSIVENDWEGLFPVFLALNTNTGSSSSDIDPSTLSSDPEKQENLTKAVNEAQRVAGGELHNVSSVLGGMVAQEAIKLLTRQYVPVDGTCVFDGVRSKVGVFKL
ncbi:uncharacterized protein A1O9_09986 [Exophiala aquamarina CBS 119918]|uniref:NEDD8-activating enzyme E1 regulatory subunit n=1 Tax=Exophiala aquamarina CBS 119918 TaxID=1182545 RepID=A0A072P2X8_9EURO|nr:uncharacterized protein A1O9_09986 [Exophiala aquamarina CBS 119918]KEF54191.1 hypothetical protein A1O9_09986 [Exophiala aquamarina CBS 119918]